MLVKILYPPEVGYSPKVVWNHSHGICTYIECNLHNVSKSRCRQYLVKLLSIQDRSDKTANLATDVCYEQNLKPVDVCCKHKTFCLSVHVSPTLCSVCRTGFLWRCSATLLPLSTSDRPFLTKFRNFYVFRNQFENLTLFEFNSFLCIPVQFLMALFKRVRLTLLPHVTKQDFSLSFIS